MFGWLKEKVTQAVDARAAANALHTEFERLEQTPGAQPRLADRLTKFVFTGEGESVVAEVAAMKNTHLGLLMLTSLHGTLTGHDSSAVSVPLPSRSADRLMWSAA